MKKQKRYIACYSEKGDYAKYITPMFVGIYKTKKEAKDALIGKMIQDKQDYPFDFKGGVSNLRYRLEGFGRKDKPLDFNLLHQPLEESQKYPLAFGNAFGASNGKHSQNEQS